MNNAQTIDINTGKTDADFPFLVGEFRGMTATPHGTRPGGQFTNDRGEVVSYREKTGRKVEGTIETENATYSFSCFVEPADYDELAKWAQIKKGTKVAAIIQDFNGGKSFKLRNLLPYPPATVPTTSKI